MARTLIVESRFQGPRLCGQGGYVAGLVSQGIEGAASVTLKAPTPVDVPLQLTDEGAGHFILWHDEKMIADALPAELAIQAPSPVSFEQARMSNYGFQSWIARMGMAEHPVPYCFVCGCGKPVAHYENLLPGPTPDGNHVASHWVPTEAMADASGDIPRQIVWAVLDCPAGWGLLLNAPWAKRLTGRLTAQQFKPIYPLRHYVAMGWFINAAGRKVDGGSAIYDDEGQVCAVARATWIELA